VSSSAVRSRSMSVEYRACGQRTRSAWPPLSTQPSLQ
jgi:hypothetical protein